MSSGAGKPESGGTGPSSAGVGRAEEVARPGAEHGACGKMKCRKEMTCRAYASVRKGDELQQGQFWLY